MAMSCHTPDLPDDSFGLLLMGSEFKTASMEWLFYVLLNWWLQHAAKSACKQVGLQSSSTQSHQCFGCSGDISF
jgi:hypothetical protein